MEMKTIRIHLILIAVLLLGACTPKNEWVTYSVDDDPAFPPYSFEYPSSWTMDAGNNYIGFVSKKNLLKDVPKKLKSGQIIVGLSMNKNMAPEKMLLTRTNGLDDIIQFSEPVSITLDGYPAVYQEGVNYETNDESLFIAADVGQNMRILLSSRMAEGELELWRETLMRMAQSLQIKP
jgi:hypothetical protein